MQKSKYIIYILGLAMAAALGACSSRPSGEAAPCRNRVVVSIAPLAFFAEAIGGDSIQVDVFLPSSTDPETFEPTVKAMRSLSDARLMLVTGLLPFEHQLARKLAKNGNKIPVESVDEGLPLIYGTHSHHSHPSHSSHSSHHSHPSENDHLEYDPHIWSSVSNARLIADNITEQLSRLMPAGAEYFRENNRRLLAQLNSLDSLYAATLAPLQGRSFIVWHPSLSYFARDYGLEQIAFNQENKETSVLRHAVNIRDAAGKAPLAFFIPADIPADRALTISREVGLQPVAVNLMSAQWKETLDSVVATLAK